MQNPEIVDAFKNFYKDEYGYGRDSQDKLLAETQKLFDNLNKFMTEQELSVDFFPEQKQIKREIDKNRSGKEVISIVLGGKQVTAPFTAQSISEKLVQKLCKTCKHVYTVSRTDMKPTIPHITHLQRHNLMEASEASVQSFVDILNRSIKDHFSADGNTGESRDDDKNKIL